jgi:hypothetical protein
MLDLFQRELSDHVANAGRQPATRLETTAGEAFTRAWDMNTRVSNILSWSGNMADAAQDHLDMVNSVAGERLQNPWRFSGADLGWNPPDRLEGQRLVRERASALAKQLQRPDLEMPDDNTLYNRGLEKARGAARAYADINRGQSAFGVTGAEMAAGIGSQFADPANAALNVAAMAAVPQGSLVRALLGSAASFAGQEAVQQALTFSYQRAVNPDFSFSDASGHVLEAALGGAAFEAGGRAIGMLYRRMRTKAPEAEARMAPDVREAATVAERQADLDANNPFRTGPDGVAAHSEAMAAAERAIVVGEPHVAPVVAAEGEGGARTGRVYSGNRSYGVRYELAEADDLVTSHGRDFNANPAYPPELQPRDRGGKPAREQVYSIASDLNPERLGPNVEANSGAPIVGFDNIVESGNGRAMAIRLAYDMERGGAYKAFLERQGFDTQGFERPVLVARRLDAMTPAEREAFAHAANGSASLRMSATEQAMSDARHIAGEVLELLKSEAGVDTLANRDFVRALVAKMPAGERGGMMTREGSLSQSGVQRVKAALVARAYGDAAFVARVFDHPDPNIKTIASAMTDAAPGWARMRAAVTAGELPAAKDITDEVMQSVRVIMAARDAGENVSRAFAQGDMFASDTSALAARLFFRDGSLEKFLSKKAMAENLQSFTDEMMKQRGKGGADLFGAPPPSTNDVLAGVVRKNEHLQAAMADALKPELIERAHEDPKVIAAAEQELRRNMEQGKNRVPTVDADGKVSLGFVDGELHAVDAQRALAKEIEACNAPAVEAAE